MRHIPDDELHACLDQALSRSQTVEIERHLSRCPKCRAERDAIAALRDRTTDILARLGSPPMIVPPPFADLVARLAAGRLRRNRWMARSVWAAGLAGALLAGHSGWQPLTGDPAILIAAPADLPVVTPVVSQSLPTATTLPPRVPSTPPSERTAPRESRQLVRLAANEDSNGGFAQAVEIDPGAYFDGFASEPAPELALDQGADPEVSAVPVGDQDPGLIGLWRTITPDRAGSGSTGNVPLVPGYAVLRVRMQPGDGGAEVVAVDQQLDSGEMIRTISGPAQRVAALVGENGDRDPNGRVTFTIRQADRMVAVTGPADAVGSFLSRVNTRRRY